MKEDMSYVRRKPVYFVTQKELLQLLQQKLVRKHSKFRLNLTCNSEQVLYLLKC